MTTTLSATVHYIVESVRCWGKHVPESMPSSSLSYCRAMVIADRRSPCADLLFLAQTDREKPNNATNQKTQTLTLVTLFPAFPRYLIRMLDLIGSPCSISDFFCAKIFLMVFASWNTQLGLRCMSNTVHYILKHKHSP